MKNELVSIIITSYNYGRYVADAIQSALAQTYKDIEVIVIDDGSTDETEQIVKKFPVKYIKTTNRGLSSARNCGIMNSNGEFILPLDADDKIDPTYIEKAMMMIGSADVVYPDLQFFGDRNDRMTCNAPITRENFQRENIIPYCSLIRKSCLLECGGWRSSMIYGWEDWQLWIELLERGCRFLRLQEFMFFYRKHGETMIANLMKYHYQDCLKLLKEANPKFFGL
jgi:glycosyltransferase involved in cell wall biosynthesis